METYCLCTWVGTGSRVYARLLAGHTRFNDAMHMETCCLCTFNGRRVPGPTHSSTIRCLRTCMPLVHFCAHTQDDHREPKGDRCRRKSNDTSTHIHERKTDHGEPKGRQTALSHAHTKTKLIKVPCWSISQQGTLKSSFWGFMGFCVVVERCDGRRSGTASPPRPVGKPQAHPSKILEPTTPATPPGLRPAVWQSRFCVRPSFN